MATETKIVLTAQDKTRAAVDSAKRNLAGLQAQGAKLNAVMGTLAGAGGLGALAGGLSAGAFVGFVKSVTDSVDALNDVSDATGATIENISSLEEVARRTGAGLDTVETALVKMNQALNTASDPNSTAAGALKAIGLSAEELKKQDPAEALLAIAQALDGYADDANKARLVQELFGKSLKEVAPLLHDLAEQGKLNATVTEEQAKEAEKFNKQLFELQTNVQNVGRAMTLGLVPAINAYIGRISEAMKVTGGYVELLRTLAHGSWWDAIKTGLGLISPSLGPNVAATRKELAGLADELAKEQQRLADLTGRKYLNPVERDDLRTTEGNIARIEGKIAEAKKRHELAQAFQRQADLEGTDGVFDAKDARAHAGEAKPQLQFNPYTPPKPPKPPKAKVDKEYDAELEMSRRAAEAYAQTLAKLTDAQHQAEESALDLTPSQRALRDLMADPVWQAMPQTWQQVAIAQTEASVAAEKAATDQKRLNDLVAATPTAQLEKQREEMQFLAEAFERGAISADQFAEAAGTALGTLPKQAEDAADDMDQFMIQAARNIQDAFADFLFDPFKDGLGGMLKNFGQVIQRMIAQAVAADLGKRLFGADLASGKQGAELGGWAKQGLDWVNGLLGKSPAAAAAPAVSGAAAGAEAAASGAAIGASITTSGTAVAAELGTALGTAGTTAAAALAAGIDTSGVSAGAAMAAAITTAGTAAAAEMAAAITTAGAASSAAKMVPLPSAFGNAFAGAGPVSAFAAGGAFGQGEILTRPTFFRFAEGGAFRAGVAGEAGPEGALPLQRMANGKLGVSAAGMGQGGGDMHIHITVPPGTPAEQRASLAQQARTALGAMNRARRYG